MRHTSNFPVLCTTLLFLLSLFGCSDSPKHNLPGEIRKVAKLELAETEVERTFVIRGKEWKDIGSIQEGLRNIGELLKPGERIGVYSFRNFAVAYIDLTQFRDEDIKVSEKERTVTLTLPAVRVESIGRSTTINVLHERVSGSKEPIKPEEKKALQDKASAEFLESIRPGEPLYEELADKAEKKAEAFFSGLLNASGYILVKVTFEERKERKK